jgi:hypothetical protein
VARVFVSHTSEDRECAGQLHEWLTADISPTARDFLHTSICRGRSRRRHALTVLSVLLFVALMATGFAVIQQHAAQEQLRVAIARLLIARVVGPLESDPLTAVNIGLAAHRIDRSGGAHSNLVNSVTTTRDSGTVTGHTSFVFSVAFSSPDGHILATASQDTTVQLWDLTDRARPKPLGPPLTDHTNPVYSVAVGPDGHTLATASGDNTVQLWDLTDPARPKPLGPPLTRHTGEVYSVAFSPDGHTLATASGDKTVRLWDLTDRARPRPLGPPLTGHMDVVGSVAFSPDGHTLATASGDNTVLLWDLTDRARPKVLAQL